MRETNGLAALLIRPVDVDVAGRQCRIPGLPASEWIRCIVDGTWFDIVPGLVEGVDLIGWILDDEIDSQILVDAAQDALAAASGVPWWVAVRLIQAVAGDIELAGMLVLSGVDVERVSIGGVVGALYRLFLADQNTKQRRPIMSKIWQRPPGASRASRTFTEKQASDQFERMFSQFGGAQQSAPQS